MLRTLYVGGPQSSGLFRRSAKHAKCVAAKMTLNSGGPFNFDKAPLHITAALLKVGLRYDEVFNECWKPR